MKHLYTDASFDYVHNEKNGEAVVRGKIAVVGDGLSQVDKVAIGKVEGLRQYINVLELTAIARAIELMSQEKEKPDSLRIHTDSKTAMAWASKGKIKEGIRTLAHDNALEYLRKVRLDYGGLVTFVFVNREENPAGLLLEDELKREKSYA